MKNVLKAIIAASLAVTLAASCKKDSKPNDPPISEPAAYVEIFADYDNNSATPKTILKWARQNLAISESGNKVWKGANTSAVKVPRTDEDVIIGDYFQWGAYQGYCGDPTAADKGLLVYTEFSCSSFDGSKQPSAFTFKDGKSFDLASAPHCSDSVYTEYNGSASDGRNVLESSDDVASIILGGSWRMPTKEEFKAMKAATYWAWDATDKGHYVYAPIPTEDAGKVNNGTGTYTKSNALLFFPAAGLGFGSSLDDAGTDGFYWSSSLGTIHMYFAYSMDFTDSNVYTTSFYNRYDGFLIRPVSD
ncbi:MAG: hypothetical protein MJY44_05345 [Bacteroidales bacterium]|nr:hypothetical protein [Bacteroidales bacterium]